MFGKEIRAAQDGRVEHVPAGFEEKLVWLCRFGTPRVSRHKGGWRCGIEMHVSAVGAQFEIGSEFNHGSPGEAIEVLIQRMLEALATIRESNND